MTEFSEVLLTLKNFLEQNKVPYMVIGGIANLVWGETRLTRDIDITLSVPNDKLQELLNAFPENFKARVTNPLHFIKTTRVLPIRVDKVLVDFVFAGIPYEELAIERAVDIQLDDLSIKIISAEDLVIHKAISERARDFEDITGILLKQNKKLDKKYILNWLKQFAEALDRPVDKKFQELWNELLEEN